MASALCLLLLLNQRAATEQAIAIFPINSNKTFAEDGLYNVQTGEVQQDDQMSNSALAYRKSTQPAHAV